MSKIYIRNPWAQLIVDGKKTIETAAFNLPDRFINKWLNVQTENKMIIGKVKFTATKKYATAETFDSDTTAHHVGEDSPYHFRQRQALFWMGCWRRCGFQSPKKSRRL
jgi:hypothetical protein